MLTAKVYGAEWCDNTQHARDFLDHLGVAYEYLDVEKSKSASQWVRAHNEGKVKLPTIDVAGQVLCAPSDHELTQALREKGLMA